MLGYTKITRDLTERKRVVKALHASEQRFRAMFEQSPVPKWIFHPQTLRFLDVNEAAVRQYGYSREEFLAMTIREIRPAEEIERFDRALLRRSIGVGTVQLGGFKHRRKDGSLLDVEITTQSIEYAGQSAVLVLAFDVTERRQAEAALRQLNETLEHRVEARTAELERTTRVLAREIEEREYAEVARGEVLRQLVSAEEEERRRISRELHDQMGQQVTGLLLGLRVLRDTHEGARSEKLDELETLADQIARDMQAMALELRPPALDTLGLVAALQSHLAEWAERHGLAHDFHAHGLDGERLSAEMETTLYRIVQEGLTNTIKHAGATRVSLLLERGRGEIRAVLEDNGRGFDVEQTLASPENARRLGLRGMRERVALLGGEMEIESSPGGGTALFVRLPDADAHPPAEGEGPA